VNKFFELLKKYYYLFTSFFVFLVYLNTIAPTVVAADAGELAAVQYTLGIAHPTGYPLFTIIGYLFLLIPLPFTPIFQANLLAAIWTSAAVAVFIRTVMFLLNNLSHFKSNRDESSNESDIPYWMKYFISISSGLFLAFSKTFWAQSTSIEVYSLHMLLFSLSFYYLLKAFCNKDEEKIISKEWILFAVFLALGFTNHMSIIFILPAAAYLFLVKYKFAGIKKILVMKLIFLPIVVLLYSYLPLRASMLPVMNWGNPSTLGAAVDHISGKLYHQFVLQTGRTFIEQLSVFFQAITINFDATDFKSNELGLVLLVSFFGIVTSFFHVRKLFIATILILITCVMFTAFYGIPDIDNYFLAAYFSLVLFSVIGLTTVTKIKIDSRMKCPALILIGTICLLSEIIFNHYRVDESVNYLFEDYTKAMMNSLDRGSIIMSSNSSFYFPALYYQFAEEFKTDIVVAEHLLLQQRWYYSQLKKSHPEVIQMDSASVRLDTKDRSIYVSQEIANLIQRGKFSLEEETRIIPDLFLYKIVNSDKYSPASKPDFKIRFSEKRTIPTVEVRNLIITMLLNRAIYELQYSKLNEAKSYLLKLHADFPEFEIPDDLRVLIENYSN